jgi:hypothetical protein
MLSTQRRGLVIALLLPKGLASVSPFFFPAAD